jgi:glycosyltransferase involved in cell wall biosynthesis
MTKRDTDVDVVICTYENAGWLDRVLESLARQRARGGWGVLVVDNNSADDTRHVVERHRAAGAVPGLRYVRETEQGLTPARLRGVRETTAPWIAFVDDDCLLDERWIEQALALVREHPDAAAFGGRVAPEYLAAAPSFLAWRGWAFAEQDFGEQVTEVPALVGAGMVVNRGALVETGWVQRPFFADRTGRRLVSGGDVELALRLASTGRPLLYTPHCGVQHVIPPHRTTMRHLIPLARGLGRCSAHAHALTWRGRGWSWLAAAGRDVPRCARRLAWAARRTLRGGDELRDAAFMASYELGLWSGRARVALMLTRGRCEFFGRARRR